MDKQQTEAPKSASQKVSVEIFGGTYRLKTDNDAEYIQRIARMVDTRMKEIAQKAQTLGATGISVMVALEFADKYCQMKKDYDALVKLCRDK